MGATWAAFKFYQIYFQLNRQHLRTDLSFYYGFKLARTEVLYLQQAKHVNGIREISASALLCPFCPSISAIYLVDKF